MIPTAQLASAEELASQVFRLFNTICILQASGPCGVISARHPISGVHGAWGHLAEPQIGKFELLPNEMHPLPRPTYSLLELRLVFPGALRECLCYQAWEPHQYVFVRQSVGHSQIYGIGCNHRGGVIYNVSTIHFSDLVRSETGLFVAHQIFKVVGNHAPQRMQFPAGNIRIRLVFRDVSDIRLLRQAYGTVTRPPPATSVCPVV
jgi:hypothetical protein